MQTFIPTETQNTLFIILKLSVELDIHTEEQLKITCSRVWCNLAQFVDLVQVWMCKWLYICIHYVVKCKHAPKILSDFRDWEVSSLSLASQRDRLGLDRPKKSLWKSSQVRKNCSQLDKTEEVSHVAFICPVPCHWLAVWNRYLMSAWPLVIT